MNTTRQIATLRRQKTCLEKRIRQMERDAADVRRGQCIIKWAKRVVGHEDNPTAWAIIRDFRVAVAFVTKMRPGSENAFAKPLHDAEAIRATDWDFEQLRRAVKALNPKNKTTKK